MVQSLRKEAPCSREVLLFLSQHRLAYIGSLEVGVTKNPLLFTFVISRNNHRILKERAHMWFSFHYKKIFG